jgi:hypothetical protein
LDIADVHRALSGLRAAGVELRPEVARHLHRDVLRRNHQGEVRRNQDEHRTPDVLRVRRHLRSRLE